MSLNHADSSVTAICATGCKANLQPVDSRTYGVGGCTVLSAKSTRSARCAYSSALLSVDREVRKMDSIITQAPQVVEDRGDLAGEKAVPIQFTNRLHCSPGSSVY